MDRPTAPHRVYLDAATHAPLLPQAREALLAAVDDGWADPRHRHREGRRARALLDGARETIAGLLGARTEEVVFTGSHAEAVHAAVGGVLAAGRRRGDRAVVGAVEHSRVLAACDHFATGVTRVGVDRSGRVDATAFTDALAVPGTVLACLQRANGEVGTLQPVAEARAAARSRGVPVLVDALPCVGQLPPSPEWDLLTAAASAWGGPPGLGVLAVRSGVRWRVPAPEHQGTERVPGEVNIPAALAAAVALRVAESTRAELATGRSRLVDRIRAAAAAVPDTEVVGDPVHRLPHVVTFSCLQVDGEVLVDLLDRRGFALGSGSACTAASLHPSHVLAAMGVLTHGNLRVGIGPQVSEAQVAEFCAVLPEVVGQARSLLEPASATSRPSTGPTPAPGADPGAGPGADDPGADDPGADDPGADSPEPVELDARGLRCPLPIIRLAAVARDRPAGTRVRVLSTDPAARPDIAAWCRLRGHQLLGQEPGSPTADAEPVLVSLLRLDGRPAAGRG